MKLLLSRLAVHDTMRTRFEREAVKMARLHHPNIVAVHDFGLHDPAGGERDATFLMALVTAVTTTWVIFRWIG